MNVVAGPNPLEVFLLMLLGGGFGLPSGVPPTQEDPLAAKVAPAECLLYASWAGTGTANSSSGNQTEQLLAEPEIQEFLTQGRTRLLDAMRQAAANDPDSLPVLEDVSKILELVQGKPGALCLIELSFRGNSPPSMKGAGLLRVDDDAAPVQEVLERVQGRVPEGQRSSVQVGNRTFSRVLLHEDAPPITWGIAGKYLLVGIGDGSLEGLMQRAGGEAPGWLNDLRAKLMVPRISSLMYINAHRLVEIAVQQSGAPEAERVASVLGLDKIRSLATVSGLDDAGCVSRSLLAVDGAGTGLLSWIDAKPLAADDLQVIDGAAPAAVAFKLNASGILDLWLDLASQIEPRAAEETRNGLADLDRQLRINLREDLFESLGDTWRVFAQPGPTGLISGWTIAIQVRDREKLAGVQEVLIAKAKDALDQAGPGAPALRSETVQGKTVHTLAFDQPNVPVAPSWCLTDNELYIAATPQTLKPLLAGAGGRSLAQRPDVAPLFAENAKTLALVYVDTSQVVKTVLPLAPAFLQTLGPGVPPLDTSNLPPSDVFLRHLRPLIVAVRRTGEGVELDCRQTLPVGNLGGTIPVIAALALPAVGAAREAARRAQSNNNLKQIALSLHNYHDTYRAFPAGYNADAGGKPLLSWRVHVLPFLEETELYGQFHLNEPWDSPHNKALVERMPAVYRSPNSTGKPGMSNYLGVGGADGVFVRPQPGDKLGAGFAQITDGTSNTIMAVEVPDESAVIWTKPGDFAPDKEDPKRGLLGMRPGGFLAGFADGSVHFIAESIDTAMLQRLFTKSDGQAVRLP